MHELTEKIKNCIDGDEVYCDTIIRTFLEEKAKELSPKHPMGLTAFSRGKIDEILGLSDESKPEVKNQTFEACGCITTDLESGMYAKKYCFKHEPKTTFEKPLEKWCEHLERSQKFYNKHLDPLELVFQGEYWKFCPICGTPRPKVLTIRDILEKYTEPRKGFGDAFGYCIREIEEHFKERA